MRGSIQFLVRTEGFHAIFLKENILLSVLVIEKTIDARERRFFEIWCLAHGSPELDCQDKFGRVYPM
jgi:hypothetical protein